MNGWRPAGIRLGLGCAVDLPTYPLEYPKNDWYESLKEVQEMASYTGQPIVEKKSV